MNTLAQEWLKAANDDLFTIQHIINEEHLTNVVAFHAEQAVEKCFKAMLEALDINFPKTHDLRKLCELLPSDSDLDIDEETLLKVNELYIDSRYPGEFGLLPNGKPTLEDGREFYQFARDIYATVCVRLQGEDEEESSQPCGETDAI